MASLERKHTSREKRMYSSYFGDTSSSKGLYLTKTSRFISKVWFSTRPNASQVTLLGGTAVRKMRLHKWRWAHLWQCFMGRVRKRTLRSCNTGLAFPSTYATVSQWQRRAFQKRRVIGSSPMCSTIYSFKNSLLIFYKNYNIIFIES